VLSALIGVVMLVFALTVARPAGGTAGWVLAFLLVLIALAQFAAAVWGFNVWRRERATQQAHPGALVQSCLVTAGTRDELRGDQASGSPIRLSCCLVADADGIALVTSGDPAAPAVWVPWARVARIGVGTHEGATSIPNAVTLEPSSSYSARLAFIPIGRGFFGLNPLVPERAAWFLADLRALHARSA